MVEAIVVTNSILMIGGGVIAVVYLSRSKKQTKPVPEAFDPREFTGTLAADLDKIVAAPIPFLWGGKIHVLKPIDVENFMYSSEQMATVFNRLNGLGSTDKSTIGLDELIKMYARVISSVCDTIGEREIRAMSMAQMRAMLQLAYDHIMGRLKEPEEKKTQQKPPSPQAQKIS